MHVYEPADYRDMRMFLTPDGKSGFALKGNDIVSAFKHPDSPVKNFAHDALALATEQGGQKLDAFDTVLPTLYSESGFRAVARLAWNEQFAPPGWNKTTFAKFHGGEPDVVFMVHDPEHAQPYKPGDGERVASYEEGVAAQERALAEIKPEAEGAAEKILLINSNPTPQRVQQWKEQLEQQREQTKIASKEWTEISNMQGSLHLWSDVATAKDKESGRYGLYTVNDENGKLLAATTARYDAETKVGEIIFAAGTDHDAKVKSLKFTVDRYASQQHGAVRIGGTIVEDDVESRAAFEEAGFEAVTEPGKGYTEMVWGKQGKTEGEIAKEKRQSAEHAAKVLGAAQATAVMLDYDPNRVEISTEDHKFTVNEKQMSAAGLAYHDGKIVIFPQKLWDVKDVVGTTTHEVMHQKYRIVMNAYRADLKAIQDEPGPPPDPNGEQAWQREGGRYAVTKPDGSPRPPYDKKYPLYTEMHTHFLAMSTRARSDGVTPYSKEYWDEAYKNAPKGQKFEWGAAQKAENETLAEMARLEVEDKKLPGKPSWRSYYKSITHWYDELRKTERAAKAA